MDSYQAIYDAVRSKISGGSIDEAVYRAVAESGISHYAQMVGIAYQDAVVEQTRPSVLFRPKIYMDGNEWCALYGDNLQDGVAGFGKSPAKAMWEFDKAWAQVIGEGDE